MTGRAIRVGVSQSGTSTVRSSGHLENRPEGVSLGNSAVFTFWHTVRERTRGSFANLKETTMRLNKILSLLAVVTLVLVASAPASAQGSVSFGFSKFGKKSAFGIGFTAPIYAHRHVVHRQFVPGHYETRCVEVWVPGAERRVWVDPVYETVTDPCGNVTRILVRDGRFRIVRDPGYYETRHVQVWVPGYYV
jgi:hypothetical protein